jgi:hypothetical protein
MIRFDFKSKLFRSIADRLGFRSLVIDIPIFPGIKAVITDLKQSSEDIDKKIEKVLNSLKETSDLVTELQDDIEERTTKVVELKKQFDHYSKLAEIEEAKVKPLIDELEKAIGKNKKFDLWLSFAINLAAGILIFFLGFFANPLIEKWFPKDEIKNETQESKNVIDTTDSIENIKVDSINSKKE